MARLLPVTVLLCLAFTVDETLRAETPSYFRRDSGVALNDSQPLPHDFSSANRLVWKQPLNSGHSTPCVCGNSIFLTTYDAGTKELATMALNRRTGAIRWKRAAPAKKIERVHATGNPASCTPACDGQRVYSFFGSYGLLCYDLNGKLLWDKKMGPFQDEFGTASSPVLVDGKVILNEDHDIDSFVIAIDGKKGGTIWKTPRKDATRSYSTPVVWEIDGKKQLIVAGALRLTAYDIKTGKEIWWVDGLSRIVDPTPTIAGGLLYIATWTPGGDTSQRIAMEPFPQAVKTYDKNGDGKIAKTELTPGPVLQRFFRIDLNQDQTLDAAEWKRHALVFAKAQNVAVAIRPGGKGDVTKTHVKWIQRRGLPTVPSSLVYRGVMYMIRDGGIVTALNAANGKQLSQGRADGPGNYYASPVGGDGKVYLASVGGVVSVLKAGGKFEVIASHDFGARILATPVIDDGKIFIRTEKALYCFGVK